MGEEFTNEYHSVGFNEVDDTEVSVCVCCVCRLLECTKGLNGNYTTPKGEIKM